jgi:hypothetical protein
VARTPSIQDLPKEREYKLIFKKYSGQIVFAGGWDMSQLSTGYPYNGFMEYTEEQKCTSRVYHRQNPVVNSSFFVLFLKNKGHIRTLWKDRLSFWYHNDAENMHSPNTPKRRKGSCCIERVLSVLPESGDIFLRRTGIPGFPVHPDWQLENGALFRIIFLP